MVRLSGASQFYLQPKRGMTSIGSANDMVEINHQAIAAGLVFRTKETNCLELV